MSKRNIDKVFNIQIEVQYIHPEYKIIKNAEYSRSETGLMKVFEVIHKDDASRPCFVGREDFDDKNRKEDLDIDIVNTSKETIDLFRSESDGYLGHHTKNIDPLHRTYAVHIEINNEIFFIGTVFFNTNRTLKFK